MQRLAGDCTQAARMCMFAFLYQCEWVGVRFCGPEGRPGTSDVFPLSGISGLSVDSTFLSVLPSPVAPSVFSFFSFWPILLPTHYFSRDMLFFLRPLS